jgi:hypothetical protein
MADWIKRLPIREIVDRDDGSIGSSRDPDRMKRLELLVGMTPAYFGVTLRLPV